KPPLTSQPKKPVPHKAGIFHILAEGYGNPDYWLHFDIRADATLHDLDRFLRDIWLECCGHLSAFTIEEKTYLYRLIKEPSLLGPEREEYDMAFELKDVLRPKLQFLHDYDFGTTTRLRLKVLSFREGEIKGGSIQLLARNDPPERLCGECRWRKAALICTECQWKGRGWLCAVCARDHKCGEDMFLPVVNSPRVGMCGYEGSFWREAPEALKDDDLCPCGSGEEYLKCCWIREALRAKREKTRRSLEKLERAAGDKVFKSKEEMQSFADEFMTLSNREPDEDFLGLSPEQMNRLLLSPLEQNEDIVRLNKDISSKAFEKAPIVRHTLFFLSELAKVEPLRATAKGNLPLKFARLLFDEIDDSRLKRWIRFRSEEKSRKVLALRHVLGMAGWIKKEKKKYRVTRKGHRVLADGFSEQDFHHLLQTYTRKFNWSFLDLYPDFMIIQGGWLFSLFILHKKARSFTEDIAISRTFIKAFPEIAYEVDDAYTSAVEYITHCYTHRFLENFCLPFGFVTVRRERKERSYFDRLFVKTTPLCRKYFIWNIP
ncbi:MAG: SEC-C domain-containing protein, partial [Candidatus Aminicenantales bacterium]